MNTGMKIALVLVTMTLVFSCSKKNSEDQVQTIQTASGGAKTKSIDLNSTESKTADQSAQSVQSKFKVSTISSVKTTKTGFKMSVEVVGGNNRFNITSLHENGLIDYKSSKKLNDGGVIEIQARCSYDNCFKYIVLLTVKKQGAIQFQNVALSYQDGCKFYTASRIQTTDGGFVSNIDDVEDVYSISAVNSASTCQSGT